MAQYKYNINPNEYDIEAKPTPSAGYKYNINPNEYDITPKVEEQPHKIIQALIGAKDAIVKPYMEWSDSVKQSYQDKPIGTYLMKPLDEAVALVGGTIGAINNAVYYAGNYTPQGVIGNRMNPIPTKPKFTSMSDAISSGWNRTKMVNSADALRGFAMGQNRTEDWINGLSANAKFGKSAADFTTDIALMFMPMPKIIKPPTKMRVVNAAEAMQAYNANKIVPGRTISENISNMANMTEDEMIRAALSETLGYTPNLEGKLRSEEVIAKARAMVEEANNKFTRASSDYAQSVINPSIITDRDNSFAEIYSHLDKKDFAQIIKESEIDTNLRIRVEDITPRTKSPVPKSEIEKINTLKAINQDIDEMIEEGNIWGTKVRFDKKSQAYVDNEKWKPEEITPEFINENFFFGHMAKELGEEGNRLDYITEGHLAKQAIDAINSEIGTDLSKGFSNFFRKDGRDLLDTFDINNPDHARRLKIFMEEHYSYNAIDEAIAEIQQPGSSQLIKDFNEWHMGIAKEVYEGWKNRSLDERLKAHEEWLNNDAKMLMWRGEPEDATAPQTLKGSIGGNSILWGRPGVKGVFSTDEPNVAGPIYAGWNKGRKGPLRVMRKNIDKSKVFDVHALTDKQMSDMGFSQEFIDEYKVHREWIPTLKKEDIWHDRELRQRVQNMEEDIVQESMDAELRRRGISLADISGYENVNRRLKFFREEFEHPELLSLKDIVDELNNVGYIYKADNDIVKTIYNELQKPGSNKGLKRYNKFIADVKGKDPIAGWSKEKMEKYDNLYDDFYQAISYYKHYPEAKTKKGLSELYHLEGADLEEVWKELTKPSDKSNLSLYKKHIDWADIDQVDKNMIDVFLLNKAVDRMRSTGHVAWAHMGGIRGNEGYHNVHVVIDNKGLKYIEEITPESIREGLRAKEKPKIRTVKQANAFFKKNEELIKKRDAVRYTAHTLKGLSDEQKWLVQTLYNDADHIYTQKMFGFKDADLIEKANLVGSYISLADKIIEKNLKGLTSQEYDILEDLYITTRDIHLTHEPAVKAMLDSATIKGPIVDINATPVIEIQTPYQKLIDQLAAEKAEQIIWDHNATVLKADEAVKRNLVTEAQIEKFTAQKNLEMAEQGKWFPNIEAETRQKRIVYFNEYRNNLKRTITTPDGKKTVPTLAGIPYDEWQEITDKLITGCSGGRTNDIGKLTTAEFAELFDSLDIMADIAVSAKNTGIMEFGSGVYMPKASKDAIVGLFSNTRYVLKRMGADSLLDVGISQSNSMQGFIQEALAEYKPLLKKAGLNPNRNYKYINHPDDNGVIRRHKQGDILRRIHMDADGIDPYDVANSKRTILGGYVLNSNGKLVPLTKDELAFIAETKANIASGKLTIDQITAEKEVSAFISRRMDELRQIGERSGNLYDPANKNKYFTDEELSARHAVPSRSHYITHQIEKAVSELEMWNQRSKRDAQNFWARKKDGTDISIDEMKIRIDQREQLVQNADLSFRAALGHETYLYWMEPAFKSMRDLSKIYDRIRQPNLDPGDIGDIEKHLFGGSDKPAGGVVGHSVRGERGAGEKLLNSILNPALGAADKTIDAINYLPEKYNTIFRVPNVVRDYRTITNYYRRGVYGAAIGTNPSSIVKNSFQTLLTIPVIGSKATAHGIEGVFYASKKGPNGTKSVMDHSNMVMERGMHLHEIDPSELSKIENINSHIFRGLEKWVNVAPAYTGGLWKAITRNPKAMNLLKNNYGVTKTSGKSFWDGVRQAMNDGHLKGEMRVADRVAELTQFSYSPWNMPKALWSPQAKTFGQFMTWPLNYWGSYLPTLWNTLITGKSVYGNVGAWERIAILKHVAMAEAIAMVGQSQGLDLGFVSPIHTPVMAVINTREGRTPDYFQSSPFITGLPPMAKATQLAISDWILPGITGTGYKGKSGWSPVRAALLLQQKPQTIPQAIVPGTLPRKIVGVAEGREEFPLGLLDLRYKPKSNKRGVNRPSR